MKVAIKEANGEITVGTIGENCTVGETVKVDLHDENGNQISATGVVVEVLED